MQKYFEGNFEKKFYKDKTFDGTDEEYLKALKNSNTIYVGGLPEKIKEERLWHLFSIFGPIRRVIMGINKSLLTVCGFCFVEFENNQKNSAENCIKFFNNFRIDGHLISVDKDYGFKNGRQYGRGIYGGSFKNDSKKRKWLK